MGRIIILGLFGILVGLVIGYVLVFKTALFGMDSGQDILHLPVLFAKRQVIGFLPYWLLDKAKKDYSSDLTTLAYFGLTVGDDGSIQKLDKPQEENPGWHALDSGAINDFLQNAKKNNITLSLVVFNGNNDSIASLISDPIPHAQTLVQQVVPIMKQYGFTDLNLDIEDTTDAASDEARMHFTQFVGEVKREMDSQKIGTLSIDASPIVLIRKYLINADEVAPLVDSFILMTYDFHYQGSNVTGPVAPLSGAGANLEFDTTVALQQALNVVSREKLILGIPLYGYEWETLTSSPHSATLPGSGLPASNSRIEDLMKTCASCSAQFDQEAQESFVTYKDPNTGTYHQIYYPTKQSMTEKIKLAKDNQLGGVALWALGYEGSTIMQPLEGYK